MNPHDVPRQYRLGNTVLDLRRELAQRGYSSDDQDALVRIDPVKRWRKPAEDEQEREQEGQDGT